jgi:hypothetical protein
MLWQSTKLTILLFFRSLDWCKRCKKSVWDSDEASLPLPDYGQSFLHGRAETCVAYNPSTGIFNGLWSSTLCTNVQRVLCQEWV